MVLYAAMPSQDAASAYAAARSALLAMLPVNALGLLACDRIATRWTTLMETSGFVDWPALPSMEFQALSFLLPVVVGFVGRFIMVSDVRRARPVSVKLFAVAVGVTAAVCWLGILASLTNLSCPEVAAAETLRTQYQAVTRFNRGYCEAWCRADPKELEPQIKSECDPDEKTVFDGFVDVVQYNEWCRDAVTYRKYDNHAEYKGAAPFAAMKQQRDGCYVTSLGWQLISILMHIFNFPTSAVLVAFCVSYWRDNRSLKQMETAKFS